MPQPHFESCLSPMLATASNSRPARAEDLEDISRLHARVFGPGRFARSAYRVREGTTVVTRLCRVVEVKGRVVAALRMTDILIGGKTDAVLLGPIAVDPDHQAKGYGTLLVRDAIDASRAANVRVMLLIGDKPYYGRFGFDVVPPGQITLPGPVNPQRLLACEIVGGALADYAGRVTAVPRTPDNTG